MENRVTSDETVKTQRVPFYVHLVNPILKSLLRMRIPLSPTVLLTVSGRKSGRQHTTPVVRFELDGHSYLFSFFGETNWVLNLRKAGKAALRRGLQRRVVTTVELTPEQATTILKNSLTSYFNNRLIGRLIRSEFHIAPNSSMEEWSETARLHPVFEVSEPAELRKVAAQHP